MAARNPNHSQAQRAHARSGARIVLKKLITVLLSLAVLVGAYLVAFGVPLQVAQYWGIALTEEAAPAARGGPGGFPGGGPRGQGRATTVVLAPLEERAYTLVLRTIGSGVSETGPAKVGAFDTVVRRRDGTPVVDGRKFYTTGSLFADYIHLAAEDVARLEIGRAHV